MNNKNNKVKKTIVRAKRIELTALSDDEMQSLADAQSDEHLRTAYNEMISACKSDANNRIWHAIWRITIKKTNIEIGTVAFLGKPELGTVEIGLGIDEKYRRQGYAYEAVTAITNWAFSQKDVFFVSALVDADNTASQALFEKLKFSSVGQKGVQLKYELEKPASTYMLIYMSLGISLGVCFGLSSDNMAIGMSIGMVLGLALGSSLDASDKKKRAELRKDKDR